MSVPQQPAVSPYSDNSTEASWKAAKTTQYRDQWNTELSAALRAAKVAYDKIEFEKLDQQIYRFNHGKWEKLADLDEAKKEAQKHFTTVVKPAIKALELAQGKAEWAGRNLVISKQANTKAKAIAADLKARATQLKGIRFADYDVEKADLKRKLDVAYAQFETDLQRGLTNADQFIRDVKANPTAATFNAGIQNACRDLTQTLGWSERLRKNGMDFKLANPGYIVAGLSGWATGNQNLRNAASARTVLAALAKYELQIKEVREWWRG